MVGRPTPGSAESAVTSVTAGNPDGRAVHLEKAAHALLPRAVIIVSTGGNAEVRQSTRVAEVLIEVHVLSPGPRREIQVKLD